MEHGDIKAFVKECAARQTHPIDPVMVTNAPVQEEVFVGDQVSVEDLPIDDSDGGCDNPKNSLKRDTKVWTREHPAIKIRDNDLVSDNGREVFNALRAGLERPPLQPYGATSTAEFFAVATESFFDVPETLERHEPRLYEVMRDFYKQDPAARARRAQRPS